jgi:hypothetical protein
MGVKMCAEPAARRGGRDGRAHGRKSATQGLRARPIALQMLPLTCIFGRAQWCAAKALQLVGPVGAGATFINGTLLERPDGDPGPPSVI